MCAFLRILRKTAHMRQVWHATPTSPRPISTSSPMRPWPSSVAPMGTADFAGMAAACARGRDDLASRGMDAEGGRKALRLFSTWEITRYLIPVATPHFRRVLKQNPDLPQGRSETEGGAKWFTLDEVLRLRAHFAAEGSQGQGIPALAARRACRPRSWRWRTSRAASARPRPRRIWRCRRRWTATGCW